MSVGDALKAATLSVAARWRSLGAAPLDQLEAEATKIFDQLEVPSFVRAALIQEVCGSDAGLAKLHAEAVAAAQNKSLPTLKAEVGDALLGAMSSVANKGPGVPVGDQVVSKVPGNTRKRLSAQDLERLKQLPERMRDAAQRDPSGALIYSDDVMRLFQDEYQAITDHRPLYVADMVQLIRDHGDDLFSLHDRKVPIGVVSDAGPGVDPVAVRTFVGAILQSLQKEGLAGDVALITDFGAKGGSGASLGATENFPEVKRTGIMAGDGIFKPVAHVDQGVAFGKASGDESPLFLDVVSRGFMIGVGGGDNAEEQLRWFIKRNGDRAILAEGWLGATDKLVGEGGLAVKGAAKSPIEAGATVGKHIAEKVRAERKQRLESPLMKLAMEGSPKQIVEVDQWARGKTMRYRIHRILNAVQKNLELAGVPARRIAEHIGALGVEIANATMPINNVEENALWQKRAKEAFKTVGGEVAEILDKVAIDIMFASWFGIQEKEERPSFFEETKTTLGPIVQGIDIGGEHTFDVKKYAEIRLDLVTAAYLKSEDAVPEVFVGTKSELEAFYREKGYEFAADIADSNGTKYHLLSKGASRQVVIHGVDSPARLTQVGALMKSMGVDVDRVLVRGDLERVRSSNRNVLELRLAELGFGKVPIAGVILGNKNEPVSALAGLAGVPPEQIQSSRVETAGPFRFQVLEVESAGKEGKQVLLAFAPAYGELSEDLVQAAINVGARNFMIAGAGGSLLPDDQVGAIHQVTSARYGDEVYDLSQTKGITMLPVPGATKVQNLFSPTPLEQTRRWAEAARKLGAGNVDQETFPIFRALARAAEETPLTVMTGLHQSDVIGSGGLELGTVDPKFGENITMMSKRFFQALGISAVKNLAGEMAPIAGAKVGLVARQKAAGIDLGKVEIPMPDLGTIGDSQGVSTAQQFKGQKRVLEVFTEGFGAKERTFLRDTLRELNASQFWVVCDQADPNHGEICEIAEKAGFETIVVADDASVRADAILGSPTFLLKSEDRAHVAQTLDELVRDGKNDEYETNTAQHYRLHLGNFAPDKDRPGHYYSSLIDQDGIEDLTAAIRREAKAGIRAVRASVNEAFAAAGRPEPKFWAIEELHELMGDRSPIILSGASKKSMALIPEAQQQEIRELLEGLSQLLDPRKHVLVTGGTDHGVEKMAHEIFSRKDRAFDILGTITENTGGNEVATSVGNFVICGINWFGMSRPVLKQIGQGFKAENVIIAGGKILEEHASLAMKLRVRTHLMDGPPGASTDLAQTYKAQAFRKLRDLAERLGLDIRGLPV